MRVRTILRLCCFLVLLFALFAGTVLSAEPVPAPEGAVLNSVQPAPFCPAAPAVSLPANPANPANVGLGRPITNAACSASVWQQCYQRFGSCALCYCLGASCYCENKCV